MRWPSATRSTTAWSSRASYTAGRLENETDDADRDRLTEAFRETHDIRLLFRELVLSAAFRDRAKESDDACISP